MNTKIKNFLIAVSIVLLTVAMPASNTARAEAKVQDGKYYFSPCMVTKFQIKDGVLVLKIDKADATGISKNNNKNYKKYKLKVKVSKNCKYRFMDYNRMTGDSLTGKMDYKEMKNAIKGDRDFYKESGYASNFADSCIDVKNNKVVKITYVHM